MQFVQGQEVEVELVIARGVSPMWVAGHFVDRVAEKFVYVKSPEGSVGRYPASHVRPLE